MSGQGGGVGLGLHLMCENGGERGGLAGRMQGRESVLTSSATQG